MVVLGMLAPPLCLLLVPRSRLRASVGGISIEGRSLGQGAGWRRTRRENLFYSFLQTRGKATARVIIVSVPVACVFSHSLLDMLDLQNAVASTCWTFMLLCR